MRWPGRWHHVKFASRKVEDTRLEPCSAAEKILTCGHFWSTMPRRPLTTDGFTWHQQAHQSCFKGVLPTHIQLCTPKLSRNWFFPSTNWSFLRAFLASLASTRACLKPLPTNRCIWQPRSQVSFFRGLNRLKRPSCLEIASNMDALEVSFPTNTQEHFCYITPKLPWKGFKLIVFECYFKSIKRFPKVHRT